MSKYKKKRFMSYFLIAFALMIIAGTAYAASTGSLELKGRASLIKQDEEAELQMDYDDLADGGISDRGEISELPIDGDNETQAEDTTAEPGDDSDDSDTESGGLETGAGDSNTETGDQDAGFADPNAGTGDTNTGAGDSEN